MRKIVLRNLFLALLAVSLLAGTGWAVPSHVLIDVSGISGSDFQLEVALYDNSGVIGDSWALIDNVVYGALVVDFESATLEGFDDSLNPDSVDIVPGSLVGGGSWVLRIDEDPIVTPTFAYRDFTWSGATTLSFDFEMTASDTVGPFGLDELVFSILDPVTLAPLMPGLTPGFGDVLAVNAAGTQYTDAVTVTVIPAPSALLLGMIGAGAIGIFRRFRKSV